MNTQPFPLGIAVLSCTHLETVVAVPSATTPQTYRVSLNVSGARCNCKAGCINRRCWHKDTAAAWAESEDGLWQCVESLDRQIARFDSPDNWQTGDPSGADDELHAALKAHRDALMWRIREIEEDPSYEWEDPFEAEAAARMTNNAVMVQSRSVEWYARELAL
ncbi:MAG: hypothetical protein KY445_16190 [Armatimonadetes bacterium]|nr:hypothetical protein [Armatimonadota bacterium]